MTEKPGELNSYILGQLVLSNKPQHCTQTMSTLKSNTHQCSADSLNSLQEETLLGFMPRRNPPRATEGYFCLANSKRRRGHTTGRKCERKKLEYKHFKVMNWNAEALFNKKAELEHVLHEENIQI